MIEVEFLGTGTSTGVPQLGCECEVCKSSDPRDKRLRCSAIVRTQGVSLLIDCGPDFRQQMLRASDLRAGAAMVVAALMADGTSEIEEIGHIERGYENIVEKLRGLGADIRKVERMPAALEQAL